ncbi:MAG TPA: efflux RND transporter periplasmic adaptor subunit [Phycisphaerae bacterium]|nr:efflux RND transporter periplasmic adaptor subunit [Phycisphaerae bacterium]
MKTLVLGCAGMLLAVALVTPLATGESPGRPAPKAPAAGVEWQTRPSADIMLRFVLPGRVAEVLVKDGDRVKPGDVLVRLDDEAERVKLRQLKAVADDELHVKAAEAQLDQQRADLKKLEWAAKEGAATEWEIEHQRLEVKIGEWSLQKARFNRERAYEDYEQANVQVERMAMKSPIAGRVEFVYVEAGESVEALGEVVRLVKIDPLWTDVPIPLAHARRLKLGDTLQVVFPESAGVGVPGRIIHIAALADAAAETLMIRLEVPNPKGWPAGERVRVLVPGIGGVAAARQP